MPHYKTVTDVVLDYANDDRVVDVRRHIAGYAIELENGLTVSVQMGEQHYCGRDGRTAETAILSADNKFIVRYPDDTDDVQGWQTIGQVLDTIEWAARLDDHQT